MPGWSWKSRKGASPPLCFQSRLSQSPCNPEKGVYIQPHPSRQRHGDPALGPVTACLGFAMAPPSPRVSNPPKTSVAGAESHQAVPRLCPSWQGWGPGCPDDEDPHLHPPPGTCCTKGGAACPSVVPMRLLTCMNSWMYFWEPVFFPKLWSFIHCYARRVLSLTPSILSPPSPPSPPRHPSLGC